jgi:hypothetical protein
LADDSPLPSGFESLEPFLAEWVLADAGERMAKRQRSSMQEIRRLYDAMLPLGEKALDYLRRFELGALPPEGERLLKLMLSLAEIAPAVEWYGDPRVQGGFPVERIGYIRKIPDTAPQRRQTAQEWR